MIVIETKENSFVPDSEKKTEYVGVRFRSVSFFRISDGNIYVKCGGHKFVIHEPNKQLLEYFKHSGVNVQSNNLKARSIKGINQMLSPETMKFNGG